MTQPTHKEVLMTQHTPQAPCDCYIDDDHLMACPFHAAAPELLAALEDAVDGLSNLYRVTFGEAADPNNDMVCRNGRAAIRAAKGE